ncbi:MFS transporter [Nocardioides marmoribigeumensis]|uniref:NNP family nitrate/nitrite transporter-like MFS transporter n=1 Tax=Nocardioides marmoribigeumensis TaxID=433649 RepID=A0ABU2BZ22_9ACTN|nr:MFS transporter [Nocardioides marmoribigeumensis]MDR7363644.1 NNP family nitrate/nitrite transporter-like MFS transporter [Nocardioides marmoribigeumensis]
MAATDVVSAGTTQTGAATGAGRWIEHWDPEDEVFWETTGRRVARRNLAWSVLAEHLGFSVWVLWSVSAALLAKAGFAFTPQQLFWLVAVPNLVGSLLRLPYTFAVPRFGGRNWTVVSALLLLVPTLLFAYVVQQPGTPYWVFVAIAATAGVGGGNFASSMANINHCYPVRRKGAALGLNAAGGNAGVAVIQLFLPVVVGGAGLFGLVKGSEALDLPRAGFLYAGLALVAAAAAYFFMDNLRTAHSTPREQLAVVRYRHTWVMAFLYIGTFGSFIGYSSAMPLLIRLNFWNQPVPTVPGIGINFVYYAFLGALVGSAARPFGGWLADRFGGARVTLAGFLAMVVGTLAVLATLVQLSPVPKPTGVPDPATFEYSDAVRAAVDDNAAVFPLFLAAFLFVFAATGIANGSAYRMIPAIWKGHYAARTGAPGSPERRLAERRAAKESSAVLGLVGAVGAMGGFLVPITFGAPWVSDPVAATKSAFVVFTGFYVVCLAVTWAVYLRKGAALAEVRV